MARALRFSQVIQTRLRKKLSSRFNGAIERETYLEKLHTWFYISIAVAVALAANTISTIWAKSDDRFSLWLLALVLISPIVFITFGLVTARTGLVVSAGTIDSLLTITTILVALFAFHEWSTVTSYQLIGIGFTVTGLVMLHLD